MTNLLAQQEIGVTGTLRGIGNIGNAGANAGTVFTDVLSGAIGLLTAIAGIWFVFLVISGALGIMTSGSDKAAAEGARRRIMNGLIGLVIIVAGLFIVDFIGGLLGLNVLSPLEIINSF